VAVEKNPGGEKKDLTGGLDTSLPARWWSIGWERGKIQLREREEKKWPRREKRGAYYMGKAAPDFFPGRRKGRLSIVFQRGGTRDRVLAMLIGKKVEGRSYGKGGLSRVRVFFEMREGGRHRE